MKKILVITDSAVCNHDKAGKIQSVNVFFQGRTERQVVKGVAGESFNGNGDAGVIHKKPHLDDGKPAFFFADPHLALPFF